MPALILHLLAGLFAGTRFRVQTLAILALAALVEAVAVFILSGASAGLAWFLVSQSALQLGYLGGIYLRGVLERPGVVARMRRRSSENHVSDVRRG
jgi:hypothetical protein